MEYIQRWCLMKIWIKRACIFPRAWSESELRVIHALLQVDVTRINKNKTGQMWENVSKDGAKKKKKRRNLVKGQIFYSLGL